MKKTIILFLFTALVGCNQDKKIKEEKIKIENIEFTSLKIHKKNWIFNSNSIVDVFKKNIDIYTVDQVSDFLQWKKDGDNKWENDEYEISWPKKPWAVKLDNGFIIYSDTAIKYLKSVLPKHWHLPNEKDLKELDNFLKVNTGDSVAIRKYVKLVEGYSCEMHMIMEVHGISLDCSNTNEEYPIWLNSNEIFWFKNGFPVFDKTDYIYSNRFDVFAAPVVLIKDNE
jgi:hypothetical protein